MKKLEIGKNVTIEELNEIMKLPYTDQKELCISDTKHDWVMVGNWNSGSMSYSNGPQQNSIHSYGFSKYGRSAYCLNTKIRRGLTMDEFYGGGTVD